MQGNKYRLECFMYAVLGYLYFLGLTHLLGETHLLEKLQVLLPMEFSVVPKH